MSIKVLFFGGLKEHVGKSETQMNLQPGMSAEQVLCQVLGDDPHLEKWQRTVLYSINQEQVEGSVLVQDGDEVAFMPPMAGG